MRQLLFLTHFFSLFFLNTVHARMIKFSNNDGELNSIYGNDDREMIGRDSGENIQRLAQSVAMILPNDYVEIKWPWAKISAKSMESNLNICSDELFAKSLSAVGCTGFLVGEDLLATAGHCFASVEDCQNKKIIFNVTEKKAGRTGYTVSMRNIFSCKNIITQEFDGERDFALIQLDRQPHRPALKMNLETKIPDVTKVFMIGHPLGMVQVLSGQGTVIDNHGEWQFLATLDSFEGNSGSPVFNAETLAVEGILVGGQQDFIHDEEKKCYRNKRYAESDDGGESVQRLNILKPFLKLSK